MNKIPTPTIGEILKEEFMKPLHLSEGVLAKQLDLPISSVQGLLNNRCKITADTSVRLSRAFGVSDRYFLNLQNDISSRKAENS
ncbi:HigA family addiction module antitoxin [Lentilactobacillus farraginis]|uniref:HigA protein n=1 Tax=Lentilactobacillus farraginis DSM 18382 = JCM 14108 TaxID=1423743 RepID=X0PBY2_9LACO|nr:HigA family addiction module antitoxin [Lentilactobacillus farraginis]KRM06640.1 hypothetical protein FD41_GL000519 [Lentilactobacillus farraginis DSM 18382 = JCM 14108]GAF37849.1 HigA protein [Lentilactobacillus farraginis DSM 18382 = JCM 14108]